MKSAYIEKHGNWGTNFYKGEVNVNLTLTAGIISPEVFQRLSTKDKNPETFS